MAVQLQHFTDEQRIALTKDFSTIASNPYSQYYEFKDEVKALIYTLPDFIHQLCKSIIITLIILTICNISCAAETELRIITPETYLKQNNSHDRKAIIDFIVGQFIHWQSKPLRQSDLDKIWNNLDVRRSFKVGRFQIINQKLYADSSNIHRPTFVQTAEYLERLIKKYKVEDVDFIIYLRDELHPKHGLEKALIGVPSFMMSKDLRNPLEKDKLLFPDVFMLDLGWTNLITKIEKAKKSYSWRSKINKIYWRGAATDGVYNLENYAKLPRLSLAMLSRSYPDLIDAKIVGYWQFQEHTEKLQPLMEVFDILFGQDQHRVKETDHLRYKYLASIDGATCAWQRVPWIMLSNSVLLKQETNKIEWFYSAIKPYVHYVPMNERLTDIFQKLQWMLENGNEVELISKNAQNFVKDNLMPDDIDAHTVIILNEYHQLFCSKKIEVTLPAYKYVEQSKP